MRFGFAITNWETFADALIAHARLYQVTKMSESKFGAKCQIDGPLPCPDGRSPVIRAVWIVDAGTDFPRLDHRLSLRMNAIMIREHFLASLKQRGLEIT